MPVKTKGFYFIILTCIWVLLASFTTLMEKNFANSINSSSECHVHTVQDAVWPVSLSGVSASAGRPTLFSPPGVSASSSRAISRGFPSQLCYTRGPGLPQGLLPDQHAMKHLPHEGIQRVVLTSPEPTKLPLQRTVGLLLSGSSPRS